MMTKDRLPSRQSLWGFMLNKYVIVTAIFAVWLLFIDDHNYLAQRKLSQTVENLKAEQQKYLDLIEQVKIEKEDLEKNKEKYAREHYYMHKENEEVFIFER